MVHPITGMSEQDILWELPLARGMAYFHAAMLKNGVDCRWFGQEDEIMARARELIQSKPWTR
jgi:hypothetical protein